VTTAKEIARQLMNNREKTAASAGLSANANGGYTVSNLASAPYLQNAGLKAGDVILAINGRSMSDVQSNQAMIEGLMVGGKARVELMRNNTRLTITVSIPNQR
jgi:S1-C subfamily serine protease